MLYGFGGDASGGYGSGGEADGEVSEFGGFFQNSGQIFMIYPAF